MIFLAAVGGIGFAGGYFAAAGYKGQTSSGVGGAVRSFLNNALGLDDSSDDAGNGTSANDSSAGAP